MGLFNSKSTHTFSAKDQYSGALAAISRRTIDFDKGAIGPLRDSLETLGHTFTNVGFAIARVATPLALAGAAIVKVGAQFESAMTRSLSIMQGLEKTTRKDLAEAAREAALTIPVDVNKIAESYFFLASASLNATQSIKALPTVLKFAVSGNFDAARATELLTDAQKALGLSSLDAIKNQVELARVADVLAAANTLADATSEEFAVSLTRKAANSAKLFGIELETAVAVLASFANQGIKGSLAGRNFSIAVRELTTAAFKNKTAFEELLGPNSVFDENGKLNNFIDIVEKLEDRLGRLNDVQKKADFAQLGFNDRSQFALTTLIGTTEEMRKYEAALEKAAGTLQDQMIKQTKSLANQFILLKAQFKDVAIELVDKLDKPIRGFIENTLKPLAAFMRVLGNDFLSLSGPTQQFYFKLILISTIAGPLLIVFGSLIASLSTLSGLFVKFIALAGAAGGSIGGLAFGVLTLVGGYTAVKAILDLVSRSQEAYNNTLTSTQVRIKEVTKELEVYGEKIEETQKLIESGQRKLKNISEDKGIFQGFSFKTLQQSAEERDLIQRGIESAEKRLDKYRKNVKEAEKLIQNLNFKKGLEEFSEKLAEISIEYEEELEVTDEITAKRSRMNKLLNAHLILLDKAKDTIGIEDERTKGLVRRVAEYKDGLKDLAKQAAKGSIEFDSKFVPSLTAYHEELAIADLSTKLYGTRLDGLRAKLTIVKNTLKDIAESAVKKGLDPTKVLETEAVKGVQRTAAELEKEIKALELLNESNRNKEERAREKQFSAIVQQTARARRIFNRTRQELDRQLQGGIIFKEDAVEGEIEAAKKLDAELAVLSESLGGINAEGEVLQDRIAGLREEIANLRDTNKSFQDQGGKGNFFTGFTKGLDNFFGRFDTLNKIGAEVGNQFASFFDGFLDNLARADGNMKQFIRNTLQGLSSLALKIATSELLLSLFGTAGKGVGIGNIFGSVIERNRGGWVPGTSNINKDSVLAHLTPDEFVVKRNSAKGYGNAIMNAINNGKVPRHVLEPYARGIGPVASAKRNTGGRISKSSDGAGGAARGVLIANEATAQTIISQGETALMTFMSRNSSKIKRLLDREGS